MDHLYWTLTLCSLNHLESFCVWTNTKNLKKIGKKSSTFLRGIFFVDSCIYHSSEPTLAHLRVLCKSTKGTHSRCCRWYYKRKKSITTTIELVYCWPLNDKVWALFSAHFIGISCWSLLSHRKKCINILLLISLCKTHNCWKVKQMTWLGRDFVVISFLIDGE